MEQPQFTSYPLDIPFVYEENTNAVCPSDSSNDVFKADSVKALQVKEAGEQNRALTVCLLDRILSYDNLHQAYLQVKRNKGACGIDGETIAEFWLWYQLESKTWISSISSGNYRPSGVRQVDIPKPNGGVRKLGIPTVRDRVLQQAIAQILTPIYERQFSPHSYGFRPKRSAHGALSKGGEYVREGRCVVVDLDLKNFFDVVNHDRLMHHLSKDIGDKRLLRLIRLYLQSGILLDGLVSQRTEGTPQGSPLSPLLSNIVLDELDKELERRGHTFVRYADDCNIYVRSLEAGTRVMQSISYFIENKLKLLVNKDKSRVCYVNQTKFLGHTIQRDGSLTLHSQSLERVKGKVRKITRRNRGVNFAQVIAELTPVLRGWLTYFRHARCQKHLSSLDSWIRHRLRCFRMKQCKRVKTLQSFLHSQGVEVWQSWILALSGKGHWRKSGCPQAHQAMGKAWFEKQGLYNLSLNYVRLNNL